MKTSRSRSLQAEGASTRPKAEISVVCLRNRTVRMAKGRWFEMKSIRQEGVASCYTDDKEFGIYFSKIDIGSF